MSCTLNSKGNLLFMSVVLLVKFLVFSASGLNKPLTQGHLDCHVGSSNPRQGKEISYVITTVLKCVLVVLHLHTVSE